MIRPSVEQVKEMAMGFDIVPVQEEIFLLRKIAKSKKLFYLLESVEGGEKWGRYSFLGFDPIMRVTCREQEVILEENGKKTTIQSHDSLQVIRDILKDYKAPKVEGMPPFAGGFVGYFSYAMIAHAEPKLKIKRGEFPDYDFMLFDKVIAYDHLKQKISVVANVSTKGHIEANYERAKDEIREIEALIRDNSPLPEEPVYDKVDFQCNVSKVEYADIV